jgi:NitT/TauT family transport system ATP-binding protein
MTVARTSSPAPQQSASADAAPDAPALSADVAAMTPSAPALVLPHSGNGQQRIGRFVMEHVSKRFENSAVPALHDISLTCESGEFVVVVGPSGCGKSTLLSIAAGMLRPDSGKVTIDGHRVRKPGPDRAIVFQDHGLFPWLTAEQNIEFGLKMTGMSRPQRRQRVEAALRMVHLTRSAGKLVHELSGGMRQRVAIARALVLNPAMLLMDEPFAALDAQTRTLMHQQLQEIWVQTRKTILFVTHSVGEAVRLADRIIVLHSNPGRVRCEFGIDLPHPRNFDSRDVSELVEKVRREIEDEVNRVNAQMADEFWKPAAPAVVDPHSVDLGGGI